MENSLVLAPAPIEEDCVSVGEEDYMPRARAECQRLPCFAKSLALNLKVRLAVKSFLHDFGDYLEVVCYFDQNLPDSVEYALHCEDNLPATWDDESRTLLS
jgi:hypothetical protein